MTSVHRLILKTTDGTVTGRKLGDGNWGLVVGVEDVRRCLAGIFEFDQQPEKRSATTGFEFQNRRK